MNAAETSASSAIADWTPLAVVCRSCTTAEMETFISEVSTTSTNIAIESRIARRWSPLDSCGTATDSTVIPRNAGGHALARHHPDGTNSGLAYPRPRDPGRGVAARGDRLAERGGRRQDRRPAERADATVRRALAVRLCRDGAA